ncbi:CsbD family protein [Aquabacter sp. CN5-332]|uniref:CsbD family protein n=1 Tax=Aquabacter sp. CN5-332 TaxID=3156608 RepID=UPI0032B52DA7
MDSDRITSAATEFGGKVKEAAGAFTGSSRLRTEGYYDQAEGRAENTLGQIKDYVSDKPMNAVLAAGFLGFILGIWAARR